ncbi:MAG: YceI family protein [Bacteroidetes bacterium]|jgi:polyisoprenoid-binding protein YceI|nr:YceI family protein [Bacteroidota bacterium]MBT7493211.1 YceI family protein [Bacteroidota bacterium]
MKKYIIAILSMTLFSLNILSQQVYIAKNGNINFISETSIENISAKNNQVVSFLKTKKGEINFGVLIKSFKFKNALMEEHFNENYMESDKFPKAKLNGHITNIKDINFGKEGIYSGIIEGKLNIHGISHEINATAQIEVLDKNIAASSTITVKPEDYNIEIPDLVKDKIAETITIKIDIIYEPYEK